MKRDHMNKWITLKKLNLMDKMNGSCPQVTTEVNFSPHMVNLLLKRAAFSLFQIGLAQTCND